MTTEIDGYKSLPTRISVAQNVRFHKEAATGIAPFAANGIAPAFGTYQADANKSDNEFDMQTKFVETELEDDTTLDVLSVVKEQTAHEDWWNNIAIAEKTSIEKGLADVRADRTVTHSEVKKRYEKWLM
jgi:hypothetical protein